MFYHVALGHHRTGVGGVVQASRTGHGEKKRKTRAPPKTKTRRRAVRRRSAKAELCRDTNEPGGDSRRRRVSGDRGSQPRPDVQEGRPAAAAKLTPEAQARGQRAEHQPARPSAVLAKPGVQPGAESVARRVVAPCVGARSDSDEPGEARTVTPPAARFLRTFRAARQRREVQPDGLRAFSSRDVWHTPGRSGFG